MPDWLFIWSHRWTGSDWSLCLEEGRREEEIYHHPNNMGGMWLMGGSWGSSLREIPPIVLTVIPFLLTVLANSNTVHSSIQRIYFMAQFMVMRVTPQTGVVRNTGIINLTLQRTGIFLHTNIFKYLTSGTLSWIYCSMDSSNNVTLTLKTYLVILFSQPT